MSGRCVRGCCESQAAHYASLVIAPAQRSAGMAFERELEKDRPAYKRLRDEGLQPKSVKGSAELERHASSRWEIEAGRILPSSEAKRVDSANAEAQHVIASGGV